MTSRLPWACTALLTAGCISQGNVPIRCETDLSFGELDRDGDGLLTPDDLEPGQTAVAVRLEDRVTGELVGTLHARSSSVRLRRRPGTAPLRPWMGEYEHPPYWTLFLPMGDDHCEYGADVNLGFRHADDPEARLQSGRYAEPSPSFVIQEYWTEDAFGQETEVVITDIGPEGTVSGYLDGDPEGLLFDLFLRETTDYLVTMQGLAWREIPGEHVQP